LNVQEPEEVLCVEIPQPISVVLSVTIEVKCPITLEIKPICLTGSKSSLQFHPFDGVPYLLMLFIFASLNSLNHISIDFAITSLILYDPVVPIDAKFCPENLKFTEIIQN
jgi:hypothetical protein